MMYGHEDIVLNSFHSKWLKITMENQSSFLEAYAFLERMLPLSKIVHLYCVTKIDLNSLLDTVERFHKREKFQW